jgi:1-deoxy-D-xylulose-5-phosphate reductoisomerase
LTFRAPDEGRYPALRLAREVMQMGGLAGAAFNAAKERSLDHFIAGRIGFLDMAAVVEAVLDRYAGQRRNDEDAMTLDNVLLTDHLAREWADQAAAKKAG